MKPWCELLVGLFLGTVIAVPVKAQITPDGTTNTSLTPTDNGIRIDGGDQRSCCLGHRVGYNLFHSFREFSVINGTEAFFNNGSDIVNIFSRVTGGDVSRIDGLIRANGKANLYLINPAGIIFGENASLNIGGSFLGSTANSIVFPEGEFLATDGDNPPILTINMPIGLTFGNNPGEIAVNASNLQVNNGEAFVLLGGNVSIAGAEITAPGARIELGGVAEFGQVSFNLQQSGEDFGIDSISFPEGVARADVTLTNGVEVNVRAAGGGSISVNGRNIKISGGELGGSSLIAGIASESRSTEAVAGDITLNATNDITVSQGSRIFNRVEESGVGNSGGINITTTNLFLTEGSVVNASIFGEGNGGTININASGTISADKVDQDGLGSGIFSEVADTGMGNSGGINITTTKLFLRQGGQVTASTFGDGNAGTITIKASDTISADGADQDGFNSGIFSTVEEFGKGNANDINIYTNNLYLTNDAEISVESLGQGNADNLYIQANSLALSTGAALSASTPVGMGGNITLQIAENLTLRDNSTISAQALKNANGGNITIDADFVIAFPNQNNDIIARAAEGIGGEINITTNGIFGIEERNSQPPNNTNDLDASSDIGLDGEVLINQPDVNPTEALEELPSDVVDVTRLVAQNLCQQGKGSEFIVTGKGGKAPNPTQVRNGEISEIDLVEPAPTSPPTPLLPERGALDHDSQQIIVEAMGWIINERGNIELVAYKTNVNGSAPQPKAPQICPTTSS